MSADDLAQVLTDRHDTTWQVWQCEDHTWRVRVAWRDVGTERTLCGATLTAALQAAVDTRQPLPRVPRRPGVPVVRVRKDGRSWFVTPGFGPYATKRAAEAIAPALEARLRRQDNEWCDQWLAHTQTGHGIEWLWDGEPEPSA
jgi:hypothetical protein